MHRHFFHFRASLLLSLGLFACGKDGNRSLPVQISNHSAQVVENEPFAVTEIHGRRASVQEISLEGRPQKVKITLEACLSGKKTGLARGNQSLQIESEGLVRERTSDRNSGCFSWDESISFQYFTKERFISRLVHFRSSGFSQDLEVQLNPWQHATPSMAVLDPRFEAPENGPNGTHTTQLVMNGVIANFAGRSFEVDALLNLTAVRKFRFEVRPMIKRMTHQGWRDETLGNGQYILHILVESLDGKPLAAYETPVEAEAGSVNTEISLAFDDLRTTFQRNRLLVELTPLRPVPGLGLYAYEGMFEATGNGGWIRTIKTKRNILNSVRTFTRRPRVMEADTPALFAQRLDLKVPSLAELKKYDLGPSQVSGLIRYPKNQVILRKFCAWFFENRKDLRDCMEEPTVFLRGEKTEHLTKLRSNPVLLKSDASGFGVSSGFAALKGESTDETNGQTWKKADAFLVGKLNLIPKNPIGDLAVGFGTSYSWYKTWSVTKRDVKDERTDGSMDKRLDVEEVTFEIHGDVKDCLILLPAEGQPRLKNLFLCNEKPERRTVQENYYYMYQNYFTGIVLDSAAPVDERRWIALIRGEDRYLSFVELIKSRTHTVNFVRGSPLPSGVLNDSMDRFDMNRYDGYFPGLLFRSR